jgi:SAM-dependent methyltransferase
VHPTVLEPPHWAGRSPADAAAGSRTLLISELLCESVDLHAGERVLDVPCGAGSTTLAAARRFCRAVGVDAPEPLERARRRAQAEGLEVAVAEGGATELPFPDGSFDAVLSAGDAMSAPGPDGSAAELLRVCRPGGRIGLVAWTPDGYLGQLAAAVGRHLPAPAGREAPAPWGTRQRLRELFGPEVTMTAPRRSFLWRFPSAEHQVAWFEAFHDPTVEALAALGPDRTTALKAELLELAGRFDVSGDETLVLRLDYLEAVVRRPLWR